MELFAREVMPHFRARPARGVAPPSRGAEPAMSDWVDEPARRTPVLARTQVLVVGGGTAGVAAAVAAARHGADAMLVERYGSLGGLATGGLIILLLTLDDGDGRQVIGGLCQEVVDRIVRRGGAYHPPRAEWGARDAALIDRDRAWGLVWGSGPHRVRYSVAYDPEELRFALNEMIESSGVRLLLHVWACEPLVAGGRVSGVVLQGKSGRVAILADVVIDTSGDGDMFAAAGARYELEKVLPWLWFRMGGVDDAEGALTAGGWFFRTVGAGQMLLPWGATERIIRKIDATDPVRPHPRRARVPQDGDARGRSPARRGAAVPPRASVRHRHPARHHREPSPGRRVRAAPRGHGPAARRCHRHDRPLDALRGTLLDPLPLLQVRELDNLLVAGRCISVDHRTHHATKEIPACMVTGQAAGTAAALAVRGGIGPKQVDVATLQDALRRAGAIL